MSLLTRLVICFIILLITFPFIEAGQYTEFALMLALLGTISLVCGSQMTGSDFTIGAPNRFVTIDHPTPGCVWKIWGWLCWIVVILLVIGHM